MSLGVREIRRLDRDQFFRTFVSRTFHGRDVFAPVAAHLAAGRTPQELGPTLDEMQAAALQEARFDGKRISGRVIHVDGFGNLMTNIPAALFDRLPAGSGVRVGGKSIGPLRGSYAEAAEGELLLVISSWGTLEIAERGGDAARTLSLGRGAAVIAAAE
jgi:S-adenosylmethionine hydrolase